MPGETCYLDMHIRRRVRANRQFAHDRRRAADFEVGDQKQDSSLCFHQFRSNLHGEEIVERENIVELLNRISLGYLDAARFHHSKEYLADIFTSGESPVC